MHGNKNHGYSGTNFYQRWNAIKQRCYNEKNPNYKDYGGRGIKMCDEWFNNSSAFFEWILSHGYDGKLQIDRIDNDGNYEPENCRLVDSKTNNNNKRNSKGGCHVGEIRVSRISEDEARVGSC